MEIKLINIGRKFNFEWIFRKVNFSFISGNAFAILGSNGSGKSTLLQIISGHLHPSEGKVDYIYNGNNVPVEDIFRHISYSGPYLELIEEFTLREMVQFHNQFKNFRNGLNAADVIEATTLRKNQDKPIRYFSSGMKQRVKLALAILSDTPLVLLDEPVSNLDARGIEWYRKMVEENRNDRLFIICSNSISAEYDFCSGNITIDHFKS